jgi:acetolactate synthase-1/2/3 large subunit
MLRSSRAGLAFDKAVSLSRVHFLRSSASPTAVCNLKAVRQATSNARSQSTSAAASVTSRSTSSPLRFIVRENPSSSFNVVSGDHGERLVNPLSGHMDEACVQHPHLPPSTPSLKSNDVRNRFLGKTGGEIFHEMMIKHKVTHICTYPSDHIATNGKLGG